MMTSPFYKLIHFNEFSAIPKYQQLANSIIKAIEDEKLDVDDVLPSINELSFEFEICRDTAEKGYKYLKNLGIIGSVPGKGYYIKSTQIDRSTKIFLMFNKLSPHKKIIYDAFVSTIGKSTTIDFYIYNNDFALFKKLLNTNRDYNFFVIIPHFIEAGENVHEVFNDIPKGKLILLDKIIPGVKGNFGAVYEDFENDIYNALEQALTQLSKYHTIKIIFPENTYYPEEIVKGYMAFCRQYAFNCKIVHNIDTEPISEGEVYINLMENDLVTLVERIIEANYEVGRNVGVISYNETPLKKIILKGVTTISTDFEAMGIEAAKMIQSNELKHVPIPFYLKLRPSI